MVNRDGKISLNITPEYSIGYHVKVETFSSTSAVNFIKLSVKRGVVA